MQEDPRRVQVSVPAPEVVYHYTSVDTMTKIVGTRTIWATSIDYLNDSSEGEHFLRLIRDRLSGTLTKYELSKEVLEFLDIRSGDIDRGPFVASFSAERNSLPQWRSYCPSGNGVAIGFRVDWLKQATFGVKPIRRSDNPETMKADFCEVKYMGVNSQDSDIDAEIAEIAGAANRAVRELHRGTRPPTKRFRGGLFAAMARDQASGRKHDSFRAEAEYRLIASAITEISDLKFRSNRSTLVPYIELSIPPGDPPIQMNTRRRLDFVREVVIGPTPNEELSVQAVAAFFRRQQMHVKVSPSNIPFRDF